MVRRRFGVRIVGPLVCSAGVLSCTGGAQDPASTLNTSGRAVSVAQLEQALNAYGRCIGTDYRVELRYRAERFSGVQSDISFDDAQEHSVAELEAADATDARCRGGVDLDETVDAFVRQHPLDEIQLAAFASEYVACASPLLPDEDLSEIRDRDEMLRFHFGDGSSPISRGDDVRECLEHALYGPIYEY